jgi:GT2 family glycosyltransferase
MKVSVVIPTHGRRALLERLLESLARQTLPAADYEVLIVHNHTDDGTEEMARAWCGRQSFAARYFRKNNRGPARSRDFGAREGRGELIAFIDDDCVASPDWLAAGSAAFGGASNARVGLVQGMTLPMPGQPQTFPCKTVTVDAASAFYETCNIFYRREAFDAVGGFSEEFLDDFYGEDTDLGWKVVRHGYERRFAPQALVHHEVFHVSFGKWLAEPLFFENLPYLVKKHPGLRAHMFHRVFVSRDTFLFDLFLAALLLLPWLPWVSLALFLVYAVERYRGGAHVGGPVQRLGRIAVGIPRGFYAWWALVKGSMRARSFLL